VLDRVADLDILVGFSPLGAKRNAPQGGDSPLGNLIATAMWLRLGVQTDFSLTNTTGIRTDLNPGPITIEEMYNIFPFDNSISKMQLSGLEVQELFDFEARRSSGRGCVAQSQIAGARIRINCAGCNRPEANRTCTADTDCIGGAPGSCVDGKCNVDACAEQVYIGHATCSSDSDCVAPGKAPRPGACQRGTCQCATDADCEPNTPGICDKPLDGATGSCQLPINDQNLYELATSNYLAAGGSGLRVLQRNTTQFDTLIQQRDALVDYMRQAHPCGYNVTPDRPDGLKSCGTDADCTTEGDFVCACPAHAQEANAQGVVSCQTVGTCDPSQGRCVRRDCRDQVHDVHNKLCASSPDRAGCVNDLNACSIAGEECKVLSCVDQAIGNFTDNREEMLGR
jgi:5'-nucleotidase